VPSVKANAKEKVCMVPSVFKLDAFYINYDLFIYRVKCKKGRWRSFDETTEISLCKRYILYYL
jgi:hypothetical protein